MVIKTVWQNRGTSRASAPRLGREGGGGQCGPGARLDRWIRVRGDFRGKATLATLIDDIMRLSGPLPNAARHRNWLEGQKMAALEARRAQLEAEQDQPYDYRKKSAPASGNLAPATP